MGRLSVSGRGARACSVIALAAVLASGARADDETEAAKRERLRELRERRQQIDAELRTLEADLGVETPAIELEPRVPLDAVPDDGAVPAPTALEDAVPAPADDMDDGDIVIVAKRYRSRISHTTQTVFTYDESDFERRQSPLLEDILVETPGVRMVTAGNKGGGGGGSFLFSRGAASIHTLVLLNGIPLNNSSSVGEYSFDGLTTTGLSRVEILRGSYGLLYGSEAIGGVVWMETKRGKGPPTGKLIVEGGSFSTFRESVEIGGGDDTSDYFLSFTNFGSDNDNDRSDSNVRELVGRFGLRFGHDLRLDTTLFHQDGDTEIPFDFQRFVPDMPEPPDDPNHELAGSSLVFGTEATWFANDWTTVRASASVNNADGGEDDGPNDLLTFDPDGTADSGDEFQAFVNELNVDSRHREYRARAMATMYLNDAFGWATSDEGGIDVEVTVGGEYVDQYGRLRVTQFDPSVTTRPTTVTVEQPSSSTTRSWFVLADAALPDMGDFTNTVFNTGVRQDDVSTFGRESSPYAGARTTYGPTETTVRASYGEGFASPKPQALYHLFYGNPDLEAELGETYEFGATQPLFDGDLVVSATWFDMEITNAIGVDPTPRPDRPFGQFVNTGKTEHRGWEYEARADLGSGFDARASITSMVARDLSGAPRGFKEFGSAGVAWSNPRWLFSLDFQYSDRAQQLGPAPSSPDGDLRDDPGRYRLFHLTGRYRATDSLTLFARIENLTDDDWISRQLFTNKALGRAFFLGAELSFGGTGVGD